MGRFRMITSMPIWEGLISPEELRTRMGDEYDVDDVREMMDEMVRYGMLYCDEGRYGVTLIKYGW